MRIPSLVFLSPFLPAFNVIEPGREHFEVSPEEIETMHKTIE